MKQVYSIIFCGLLLLTKFTAFAQLQTGFHYKIKNSRRYKIIYSTSTTPPSTSTVSIVTSPETTTTPATITTYTTANPAPTVAIPFTAVVVDETKKIHNPYAGHNFLVQTGMYLVRRGRLSGLKAGIKQKGDSLLVDFWSIKPVIPATGIGVSSFKLVRSMDMLGSYTIAGQGYKSVYYIPLTPRTSLGTSSNYLSLPFVTWEAGLMAIPFKYRFGHVSDSVSNQLASSVNAGIYIGRKWGRTHFHADPTRVSNGWSFMLAVVGTPTVISINSKNTGRQAKVDSDEMGFSFGGAVLASYGSITTGLVGGWDLPVTGKSDKWIYAKKFWLGFGVGYKLGGIGDK